MTKADEKKGALSQADQDRLKKLLDKDARNTSARIGLSVPTLARAAVGLEVQPASRELIRLKLQEFGEAA